MSLFSRCVRMFTSVAVAAITLGGSHALAAEPAPAVANAQNASAPTPVTITQPKYQVLRFNEDWSVLADQPADAQSNLFDPIKYVPLSDGGDWWMSFGGQYRIRLESWNNFGFNDKNDDTFALHRLRLHGDLHLGEHFRIFAEGISAVASERDLPGGRRTLDADSADLLNLFAEFTTPVSWPSAAGDARLTLRAGRQEMLFGKQRLVSPLDWANTRRTFDGFTASLATDRYTLTGFYTHPVLVQKYEFNDLVQDDAFYGIYSTFKLPQISASLDAYWLGLHRDAAAFNGTAGEENRHTFGARLAGKCGNTGFDYDIEAAWQTGKVGSGDINAWMLGAELGYAFADHDMSPRLWLGFDFATGDNSPGGDVETFNQLFPLGHAFLGYIDAIGRQNIVDASTGVSFTPITKLNVSLAGHLFWRADTDDALYNAGGGVARGPASDNRYVGAEIDLLLTYAFNQHLSLSAGYSHFFAGSFLEQTGPDDDVDFTYASLQYTF